MRDCNVTRKKNWKTTKSHFTQFFLKTLEKLLYSVLLYLYFSTEL